MSNFKSFDICASALTAQRLRMDIISQNIANANTTKTDSGEPYRRKTVLFEERQFSDFLNEAQGFSGVRVSEVVEDQTPFKREYNPNHPDADDSGYVSLPNVDVITEMVNMISATRSYEAMVTCMNSSKSMYMKAAQMGS